MRRKFFSLSIIWLYVMLMFMAKLSFADSLLSQNDGYIELPLTEFYISDGDATVLPVTQSTAPGLEVDNKLSDIVWADGETTPISTTFRVPPDYSGSGEFRLLTDESNSTTPNEIDFSVYINKPDTAWDSVATNQTPVALDGTAGTPVVVTLKPATDFSNLQPNQYVTLNVWRDNTAAGTGDLELYHLRFYYKKKAQ